jgi:hypothetical protein
VLTPVGRCARSHDRSQPGIAMQPAPDSRQRSLAPDQHVGSATDTGPAPSTTTSRCFRALERLRHHGTPSGVACVGSLPLQGRSPCSGRIDAHRGLLHSRAGMSFVWNQYKIYKEQRTTMPYKTSELKSGFERYCGWGRRSVDRFAPSGSGLPVVQARRSTTYPQLPQ